LKHLSQVLGCGLNAGALTSKVRGAAGAGP